MSVTTYKTKAVEEMRSFLDRSGEEAVNFIIKVQVIESVLTVDLADEVNATDTHELNVVLLAKTPQGIQVAYSKIIPFSNDDAEDDVLVRIEEAFPTQEEIDAERAKAAEEAKKREEFQQQMQQLDPQELAKMALQQAGAPGEDTENPALTPEAPVTQEPEENK
jgi:hypothetical protein